MDSDVEENLFAEGDAKVSEFVRKNRLEERNKIDSVKFVVLMCSCMEKCVSNCFVTYAE